MICLDSKKYVLSKELSVLHAAILFSSRNTSYWLGFRFLSHFVAQTHSVQVLGPQMCVTKQCTSGGSLRLVLHAFVGVLASPGSSKIHQFLTELLPVCGSSNGPLRKDRKSRAGYFQSLSQASGQGSAEKKIEAGSLSPPASPH